MLKKLTKKQSDLMLKVKDEWINRAYNPIIDKEKIKQSIFDLYDLCGLKKPQEVIVVESILGLCLLNKIIKEKAKILSTTITS